VKVLVTGATGFVGRHVVDGLLKHGHSVVATARSIQKAQKMPWIKAVIFTECDLHRDFSTLLSLNPRVDVLIHLAWPGLPNYRDSFHIDENLPAALRFLEAAVASGIPHLAVAGTCLEYGMQSGPLSEEMTTAPTTPYGFAKDSLRKSLQLLQQRQPFTLQWIRLFYMFGEGQDSRSLLPQLDRAIDEGQPAFSMSAGDQLRDYMSVREVAANFVRLIENPDCNGVINCCSGNPISVRQLVERRCQERGSDIRLDRGVFPYPDYEPLAFWGVPEKLRSLAGG
jgi:nucleoside-diphosphate-sugar epimerase